MNQFHSVPLGYTPPQPISHDVYGFYPSEGGGRPTRQHDKRQVLYDDMR